MQIYLAFLSGHYKLTTKLGYLHTRKTGKTKTFFEQKNYFFFFNDGRSKMGLAPAA